MSGAEEVQGVVFREIADERNRQAAKGFDAVHDDAHQHRQIIYARHWGALDRLEEANGRCFGFPEYRGDLIKVLAMIVAEVERLDRAALAQPAAGGDGDGR
jgi:hypothetical protein